MKRMFVNSVAVIIGATIAAHAAGKHRLFTTVRTYGSAKVVKRLLYTPMYNKAIRFIRKLTKEIPRTRLIRF
jgi:uncharacterized MAPEG superfamily protein